MNWHGTVLDIFIGNGTDPLAPVASVTAVAGEGLEGDRNRGSAPDEPGTQITLIEQEAIDAIAREQDIVIEPIESRRNILTHNVPLNHLVGHEFMIGDDVRCRGILLCEPCGHLEKMTGKPGIRKALVHRGGLRAEIVAGGTIARGDVIRPVGSAAS